MEYYSSHINKLIEQLSHLPGIGAKSAQRLAFHIMNMPKDQVEKLTSSITDARQNVQYCKCCYTLTDQELCPICANPKRESISMVTIAIHFNVYPEKIGGKSCFLENFHSIKTSFQVHPYLFVLSNHFIFILINTICRNNSTNRRKWIDIRMASHYCSRI